MKTKTFICLFILIAMFLTHGSLVAPAFSDEIMEDLKTLAYATHGPVSWASGDEVRKILEKVKGNPDPYLSALEGSLTFPEDPKALLENEFLIWQEMAITVLEQINNKKARDLLKEIYFDSVQSLHAVRAALSKFDANYANRDETIELGKAEGIVEFIHNSVVQSLTRLNDKGILQDSLKRLEGENYGVQVVLVEYIAAVGKGDPNIRKKLLSFTQDENSTLSRNLILKNMIQKLLVNP